MIDIDLDLKEEEKAMAKSQKASDRPLVTFALVAYNQERYVRAAIEGAFSQTYEPLEIILSDDCSADRTFEIMQEMASSYDGRHTVWIRRNETNLGMAGHMNAVVNAASGELIAWAAGDDISMPHRVSLLSAPIIQDSHVISAHSSLIEIDTDGNQLGLRNFSVDRNELDFMKMIELEAGIISQTHIFRKIVFQKFGPLDVNLANETLAMTFRELCLGRIIFVDKPTIYYRIDSGVSNYRGSDVNLCTITEPLKVSKWRFSEFSQMCNDFNVLNVIDESLMGKIVQKKLYYDCLVRINSKPFALKAVFELVAIRLFDTKAAWAFLRRSSPEFVRLLYVKVVLGR